MRPTNNIGYLLQHLASVLARQSDQILQERLGLGFSQFKILMALKWNPYVQQKQIAEALGQTEASVSRQIKLLHEGGLLETRIKSSNRREHITAPTAKGVKVTEQALAVLNDYHAPVFQGFSEREQNLLLEILTKMHTAACRADRPNGCHNPLFT